MAVFDFLFGRRSRLDEILYELRQQRISLVLVKAELQALRTFSMSIKDDITALLTAAQTSLDGIVADIAALKAAVVPGMTDAEAEEIKTGLQGLADRLSAVDLENPAP